MQRSDVTPDQFLASVGLDVKPDMETLDRELSKVMTGLERVLWEGKFWGGSDQHIIGYGAYRYQGRSGRSGEWFVVGLAAQKNYLTVFVNAAEGGKDVAPIYARLGKAKIGRSTISFKRLSDIDLSALLELVTRARDLAPPS